jgi:hypothetical protein
MLDPSNSPKESGTEQKKDEKEQDEPVCEYLADLHCTFPDMLDPCATKETSTEQSKEDEEDDEPVCDYLADVRETFHARGLAAVCMIMKRVSWRFYPPIRCGHLTVIRGTNEKQLLVLLEDTNQDPRDRLHYSLLINDAASSGGSNKKKNSSTNVTTLDATDGVLVSVSELCEELASCKLRRVEETDDKEDGWPLARAHLWHQPFQAAITLKYFSSRRSTTVH